MAIVLAIAGLAPGIGGRSATATATATEPPGEPWISISSHYGKTAFTEISIYLPVEPDDPATALRAVEASLGCATAESVSETVTPELPVSTATADAGDEWEDSRPGWYGWAECRGESPRRARALEYEAELDLSPTLAALQRSGIDAIQLYIGPLGPGPSRVDPPPESSLAEPRVSFGEYSYFRYEVPVPTGGPSRVLLRFGYGYGAIAWAIAPLAPVLVLPLLFAAVLKRRARRIASPTVRARLWYRLHGIIGGLATVTLLTYGLTFALVARGRVAGFARVALWQNPAGITALAGPGGPTPRNVALILPVLIVLVAAPAGLAYLILMLGSERALFNAFEAGLTRPKAWSRVWWREISYFAPVIFGVGALLWYQAGQKGRAAYWVVGGLVLLLLSIWRLQRARGFNGLPIAGGELHDTILALADEGHVPVTKVAVFRAGNPGITNAAKLTAGRVAVTDYVVEGLDKRETDALIANEVARLGQRRAGHLLSYAVLLGGSTYALIDRLSAAARQTNSSLVVWLAPLAAGAIAGAGLLYWSRRQEREIDRRAVLITADPEGMISALSKLADPTIHPSKWGRAFGIAAMPPSIDERIRSIAADAGITSGSVRRIRSEGLPSPGRVRYALPDDLDPDAASLRGELADARKAIRVLGYSLFFASILLPAALVARAIQSIDVEGILLMLTYVGGLMIALGAAVAGIYATNALLDERWRRAVLGLIRAQGFDIDQLPGSFGMMSPGRYPRHFHDLFTAWAYGITGIADDHFFFVGDEVSFSLRPSDVLEISSGPGRPELADPRPVPRTCIGWTDRASGSAGIFSITLARGARPRRTRADELEFRRRLEKWAQGPDPTAPPRPALAALGPPAFDTPSSRPLRPTGDLPAEAFAVALVGMLGLGAAMLLGASLSFDRGSPAVFAAVVAAAAYLLEKLPLALSDYKAWTDGSGDSDYPEGPEIMSPSGPADAAAARLPAAGTPNGT